MPKKTSDSTSLGIFDLSPPLRPSSESPEHLRVRSIEGIRRVHGTIEYFVQWLDFNENEGTWEPLQHLKNCHAKVLTFHKFCIEQMKTFEEADDIVNADVLDENNHIGGDRKLDNDEDDILPGYSDGASTSTHQSPKGKKRLSSASLSYLAKKGQASTKRRVSFFDQTLQTGQNAFVRHGSSQNLYPAIIMAVNGSDVQIQWSEGNELESVKSEDVVLVDKILNPGTQVYMFFPGKNHYNEGKILHKNMNDTWDVELVGRKNKARDVELYRFMILNDEFHRTNTRHSPEV